MRRFLLLFSLLFALPASAQDWVAGTPSGTSQVLYDQVFTHTWAAAGLTATNQDVSGCSSPAVSITVDATAVVNFLDCPGAVSGIGDCQVVATLPNVEQGTGPIPATFAGFAKVDVANPTGAGTATVACSKVPGKTFIGGTSGWGVGGLTEGLPADIEQWRNNNIVFWDWTADWEAVSGTTTYTDTWLKQQIGTCPGACNLNRYATDLEIPVGNNAASGVQYSDQNGNVCVIGDGRGDEAGEKPYFTSMETRVLTGGVDGDQSWFFGIGDAQPHMNTAGVTVADNHVGWKHDEAAGDGGIPIPVWEGQTGDLTAGGEEIVSCPTCAPPGAIGFVRYGFKILNDGDQAWWYINDVEVATLTPVTKLGDGSLPNLGLMQIFAIVKQGTGNGGVVLDYSWCSGRRGYSEFDQLKQN